MTGQVIHFDGRDLVVWAHPRAAAVAAREGWDADAIGAFFAADPPPTEPPHPDRWGAGAQTRLIVPDSYP
jgi:hypothetical protein